MNDISHIQNSQKIFFEKFFFTTAVTSLFFISYLILQRSNSQQNTMKHKQSTLYLFFIRHTTRIYLHHMLFFHIDTMMLNDFYETNIFYLPLRSRHTVSNSTISLSHSHSSLPALKTTLSHEFHLHN